MLWTQNSITILTIKHNENETRKKEIRT